jgi:hypothetical protein
LLGLVLVVTILIAEIVCCNCEGKPAYVFSCSKCLLFCTGVIYTSAFCDAYCLSDKILSCSYLFVSCSLSQGLIIYWERRRVVMFRLGKPGDSDV